MKIKSLLFWIILFCSGIASSQSIWDKDRLEFVKEALSKPCYSGAYRKLLKDAEHIMALEPLSVMLKEKTPASGSKHDYMSQARYYWPDPTQPDGKPYINRDGVSNPELDKLDRNKLGDMAQRVTTLSLAWYFSCESKYATKATELIRIWFFNADTKMNPNLKYAQVIPGRNGDQGRCYGVIDAYSFVEMLDAVQLLHASEAFTLEDERMLKEWFSEFLSWILNSDQGQEEAQQKNNHSVAHDAQVIAFAMYVGNWNVANKFLREFPERRIYKQIEPDGRQPHELRRTLAFGYSQFNLHHMIDVILMGQKLGFQIDKAVSGDGRSFYKAVDFLVPYLGKRVKDWPYQQLSSWEEKQKAFSKDLYRIYSFNNERIDYLNLFLDFGGLSKSDRFYLLYYQPIVL